MDFNDLTKKIKRAYINIGELSTPNFERKIKWAPNALNISFGSTDDLTDETKILNAVGAIADMKDCIKRKMSSMDLSPKLAEDEINNNLSLQLITDLDNQQKHIYPLTNEERSHRSPQYRNVHSYVKFTFGSGADSGIAFDLVGQTVNPVGNTVVKAEVEAEITDKDGNFIVTLDTMINDAIAIWDNFFVLHNIK
ncbi:hypothetical protein [Spirosoma endophyticum]|uniref:Uncharacterized protein n=1 Tax=Spirosoma endophyticum TaxID=662367 RepID=A0A1I1WBA1_9BACT|nr:hypothetical protein [Spirosoma endophyticum]SFD92279.1 hypothetical protein SAMN05216167_108207 [Spirosoma endophyticum]